MKVFCFTCGNDEAQVVATKGEHNLVECTKCGCRWRRSLDPLYERTALVEVDVGERIATAPAELRNDSGRRPVRLICANALLEKREIFSNLLIGEMEVVFVEDIEKALTIDPDSLRPHGRWILLDECSNAGVYCSVCQKKVYKEQYANQKLKSNFCPNCGADMREGIDGR